MRVYGPGTTSLATRKGQARRKEGDGFRLPSHGETQRSHALSAQPPISGISALLALQDITPDQERRKAIARGHALLDILDELKLDILAGKTSPQRLQGLRRQLAKREAADLPPSLKAVLNQIELRAAVELAKWERARTTPLPQSG